MSELKPCPFCGGTELYFPHGIDPAVIRCGGKDGCGCTSGCPDVQTVEDAALIWNRRSSAAMELPEVKALVHQYEMLLEDLTEHGGYTYEDDFGADLAAIAAIKEPKT